MFTRHRGAFLRDVWNAGVRLLTDCAPVAGVPASRKNRRRCCMWRNISTKLDDRTVGVGVLSVAISIVTYLRRIAIISRNACARAAAFRGWAGGREYQGRCSV